MTGYFNSMLDMLDIRIIKEILNRSPDVIDVDLIEDILFKVTEYAGSTIQSYKYRHFNKFRNLGLIDNNFKLSLSTLSMLLINVIENLDKKLKEITEERNMHKNTVEKYENLFEPLGIDEIRSILTLIEQIELNIFWFFSVGLLIALEIVLKKYLRARGLENEEIDNMKWKEIIDKTMELIKTEDKRPPIILEMLKSLRNIRNKLVHTDYEITKEDFESIRKPIENIIGYMLKRLEVS